MAKKKSGNNSGEEKLDAEKEEKAPEEANSNEEEKPILPRKRKIVKNNQLTIVLCIFLAVFVVSISWKLFFNRSIVGSWYYINNGEYTETFDSPESGDTPQEVTTKYTQRVCYEFKDDGECIVTLGTMSVIGQYDVYSIEGDNVLTASVAYQNTALLYGSYYYRVEGNAFTGRKLIISDISTGEELKLDPGMGENPLTPYENAKLDDRLTGTWRDEAYGVEYEFKSDGYMTRTNDDGMVVEHVYTIFEDEGSSYILTKYFGDSEQTYSYSYSFDGENAVINGSTLKKIK